jgi:hypothetical protein
MGTIIIIALFVCSIYLAGRIAAWIAAIIGPLAFPLVFLFPNLHREDGERA